MAGSTALWSPTAPAVGGAAYAINTDGTGFTILKSFVAGEVSAPVAGICQTTDGMLYTIGSSGGVSGKGGVVQFRPDGTGFATVREFGTPVEEPSLGMTSLIEAPDGRLYFATFLGGATRGWDFGTHAEER